VTRDKNIVVEAHGRATHDGCAVMVKGKRVKGKKENVMMTFKVFMTGLSLMVNLRDLESLLFCILG
jgi:hypothetical protein